VGIEDLHAPEHLEAIDRRELEIKEEQINRLPLEVGQPCLPGCRRIHLKFLLEQDGIGGEEVRIVINNENARGELKGPDIMLSP
jgi:hypothetical protein